jgi:hypothetical protein
MFTTLRSMRTNPRAAIQHILAMGVRNALVSIVVFSIGTGSALADTTQFWDGFEGSTP